MNRIFEKRECMDLAGDWHLSFASGSEEDPGEWITQEAWRNKGGPIAVPGIWNLSYPDQAGIGYYRKCFEIPAGWGGDVILLNFVGSCYRTEAWLNRQYLGSHEGGYTPFRFDLTAVAHPGAENELIVRVAALSKTDTVDGMALKQCPASKQTWHYTYGGIWGEIYLERCPWVSVESVYATPNLKQELADVEISLNNRRQSMAPVPLKVSVTDPNGDEIYQHSEELSAPPGQTQYHYSVEIPNPQPWSCEEPRLYRLQVNLNEEKQERDRANIQFGMRDFTVRNGRFYLNGEPIFLRGILLQPNYPVTLVVPPDPEMMIREISLAKAAGFNLIRVHIRPAAPGFLDLADQLGMMVYAESSLAWIRESPRMSDHGHRELREMIARDRNHPSVVFWGVYNENPPAAQFNGPQLANFVRSIDPTRVVVMNSGGSLAIDQDFGWIDRASIIPERTVVPEEIQDIHLYTGGLISDPVYDWIEKMGTGVSAAVLAEEGFASDTLMQEFDRHSQAYTGHILVSEIGCGGISNLDETVAKFGSRTHLKDAKELEAFRKSLWEGFAQRQLDRVFGSVQNFYAQAQELQASADTRQLEALLCNPRISGYILTALDDVAWECHGGLLDLWRNPKPAYAAAQRVNRPGCLILRTRRPAIRRGESIEIDGSLVSRQDFQGKAELTLNVVGSQDEDVFQHKADIVIHKGRQVLQHLSIPTGQRSGLLDIEGVVRISGKEIARSVQKVLVLDPPQWEDLAPEISVWGSVPAPLAHVQSLFSQQPGAAVCLAMQPGKLSAGDWASLLKATAEGKSTILGDLQPKALPDWHALTETNILPKLAVSIGSWMGCYHWIPDSELFSGLPNRILAGETYRKVIPHYSLDELGGQVLAGAVRNTQSLEAPAAMLWYSDIERVPYGRGQLIFCQYRIFENCAADPVAGRMLFNLVQYALRTPVPVFKETFNG